MQADRKRSADRSVLLIGQILLHFSIVTWGASFTWEKQNLRPMHVGTCMTEIFSFLTATTQADRKCGFFQSVLLIGQILLHFSIVTWGCLFHLGKAEFASDACGYLYD